MGQSDGSSNRRFGARAAGLLFAVFAAAGCAGAPLHDLYAPGTVPAYTPPASNLCAAAPPAPAAVVLACSVTDPEDAPVAGAAVELWFDRPPFDLAAVGSKVTDAEGTCVFKVPEGDVILRVRHEGHPSVSLRAAVFGPGTQALAVALPGGVALRGAVRGPGGEPLAGARVTLLSDASRRFLRDAVPVPILSYLVGRRHPLYDYGLVRSGAVAQDAAVTGAEGGFSFRVGADRLSPGAEPLRRPVLLVSAPGFLPRVVRVDRVPAGVLAVSLSPEGRVLAGTVCDGAGAPLDGAMVFAALPDPVEEESALLFTTSDSAGGERGVSRPWYAGPTGADGRFRLPLPDGVKALKYLAVFRPGCTSRILYGFEEPADGTGPEGLRLYLNPGTKAEVRVEGDQGRPEGCDARAGCAERGNFLDGWFDGTAALPTAGGFSVEGAGVHAFYLRVEAPGYAPELRLVRRSPLGPVELRLRRGKTLVGRVVDRGTGEGVEGAEVRVALGYLTVLVGVEDFTVRRSVRTGAGGAFAVEDLPADFHAGKVYVFVGGDLKWRADLSAELEPLEIGVHAAKPASPGDDGGP